MECPTKSLTLYVNCNSSSTTQTGLSWDHALTDLQSALDIAGDACGKVYILVARGVYVPSVPYYVNDTPQSEDSRSSTFHLPNNTYIIGGFSGNEVRKNESCPDKHETILSGLKYYWNVVRVGNEGESSQKFSAAISNVTITGSAGSTPGGGVRIDANANVKLDNVKVMNNYGVVGGGVYVDRGKLLALGCTFSGNAASDSGGAIFVTGSEASITVNSCMFANNTATSNGGAIGGSSSMAISCCEFVGNSSVRGGAVSAVEQSTLSVKDSKFKGNFSSLAAGAIASASIANIESTKFDSNTSGQDAGAVWCAPNGKLDVYDCIFKDNIAQRGSGGGLFNSSKTTVLYSKFGHNKSLFGNGGAIASIGGEDTNIDVEDTIFRDNHAVNGEGDDVYTNTVETK